MTNLYLFLNTIFACFAVALRLYYWLLLLRVTIQWFPNINPYIQPIFVLIVATDPYLALFDNMFPIIFGMDLSVVSAFIFLEWLILIFESIEFIV